MAQRVRPKPIPDYSVPNAAHSRRAAIAQSVRRALYGVLASLVVASALITGATWTGAADEDGYVGCSMTVNAVDGYRAAGGTGLWPTLGYKIGGGILERWSTGSSAWWAEFDQQVSTYGPPGKLFLMVCAGKAGAGVSASTMMTVLDLAEDKAPGAEIVVMAQPRYEEGHLCTILGNTLAQQQCALAKVDSAVAQAVTLGGVPGPVLPKLGLNTTRDGCHANTAGKALLGKALLVWETPPPTTTSGTPGR